MNDEGLLTIKTDQAEELQISFDTNNGKIKVDRTKAGLLVAADHGTTRESIVDPGKIEFELYLDNTVFELYINQGQKVLTGRIFPKGQQFRLASKNVQLQKEQLEKIY